MTDAKPDAKGDWWDKVNLDPEVIRQRSSEPPMLIEQALNELSQSRMAWHEAYGVPVSPEHARFMTAIGVVQELLAESREPAAQPRLAEAHEEMHKYLREIGDSNCELCEALSRLPPPPAKDGR
jgi:hypothetical protein